MKALGVFFAACIIVFTGCGTGATVLSGSISVSEGVRGLGRVVGRAVGIGSRHTRIDVQNHINGWVEVVAYDKSIAVIGPNARMFGGIEDTDERGEIPFVFRVYADKERTELVGVIARVYNFELGQSPVRDIWAGDIVRVDGWGGVDPRSLPPQLVSSDVEAEIPGRTSVWKPSTTYIQVVNAQRFQLVGDAVVNHKGETEPVLFSKPGEVHVFEIHNSINVEWLSRVSFQFTSHGISLGYWLQDFGVKSRAQGPPSPPRIYQRVITSGDRRDGW